MTVFRSRTFPPRLLSVPSFPRIFSSFCTHFAAPLCCCVSSATCSHLHLTIYFLPLHVFPLRRPIFPLSCLSALYFSACVRLRPSVLSLLDPQAPLYQLHPPSLLSSSRNYYSFPTPLHVFSICCPFLPADRLGGCHHESRCFFPLPLPTIDHLLFRSSFTVAAAPSACPFRCATPVSAGSSSLFPRFSLSVTSANSLSICFRISLLCFFYSSCCCYPSSLIQDGLWPSMMALISDRLLRHPNTDARISVMSCICEVLRISAPHQPYENERMKDIFRLTLAAFEKLSLFSGRCYAKALHILEIVAKVKCCIILLDIGCNSLVTKIFEVLLSTIKFNHPQAVFSYMEDIMT